MARIPGAPVSMLETRKPRPKRPGLFSKKDKY